MANIKRFHVRDGYVLDEHPEGSVVRYDGYVEVVNKLEQELREKGDLAVERRGECIVLEQEQEEFRRVSEARYETEHNAANRWQEIATEAEQERDRLRAAIELAPCPKDGVSGVCEYGPGAPPGVITGCDCWKVAALEGGKNE